jgi:hypothetical protein
MASLDFDLECDDAIPRDLRVRLKETGHRDLVPPVVLEVLEDGPPVTAVGAPARGSTPADSSTP